jgi:molybdopterin molybdotransferase
MLPVQEALGRILGLIAPLVGERARPLDALGQVLAVDVLAGFDIPPADNSAMDGYAVRAADTVGASAESPRRLLVVGEVPAGRQPTVAVQPGAAVRIMTGAVIPPDADSVVQFEHTSENGRRRGPRAETVDVFVAATLGQNIRRAGEDVRRNSVVLPSGTELRPAEVGVIASLGIAAVEVVRRPRVAVLSTGDELLAPGEPLAPGHIYDANSYSVAALVKRYGGVPVPLGIARDTVDDLRARVRAGLNADLFISSAGVSTGDYDVVKDVLAAEGQIDFWQVAIKPGKPLAVGRIGNVPFVGLPGNPVASMVAFEQFVRPAILKMLGKKRLRKPEIAARLVGEAGNRDGRRCFYRAFVTHEDGGYVASLTGPQGSGILTSMALANGLVVVPEDVKYVRTGDPVRVQMLDWPEMD